MQAIGESILRPKPFLSTQVDGIITGALNIAMRTEFNATQTFCHDDANGLSIFWIITSTVAMKAVGANDLKEESVVPDCVSSACL